METERSERKRLESYTRRLKSEMQTLNSRMERRSTEKPLSEKLLLLSRPLLQPQQKQDKTKKVEEATVNGTPLLKAVELILNSLQEDKDLRSEKEMENFRKEIESKQLKIDELENSSRLLEVRCTALELETANLKASNISLTDKYV